MKNMCEEYGNNRAGVNERGESGYQYKHSKTRHCRGRMESEDVVYCHLIDEGAGKRGSYCRNAGVSCATGGSLR